MPEGNGATREGGEDLELAHNQDQAGATPAPATRAPDTATSGPPPGGDVLTHPSPGPSGGGEILTARERAQIYIFERRGPIREWVMAMAADYVQQKTSRLPGIFGGLGPDFMRNKVKDFPEQLIERLELYSDDQVVGMAADLHSFVDYVEGTPEQRDANLVAENQQLREMIGKLEEQLRIALA